MDDFETLDGPSNKPRLAARHPGLDDLERAISLLNAGKPKAALEAAAAGISTIAEAFDLTPIFG